MLEWLWGLPNDHLGFSEQERVEVSVSEHLQQSTVSLFRAGVESSYLDLVPESLIEIVACGVL